MFCLAPKRTQKVMHVDHVISIHSHIIIRFSVRESQTKLRPLKGLGLLHPQSAQGRSSADKITRKATTTTSWPTDVHMQKLHCLILQQMKLIRIIHQKSHYLNSYQESWVTRSTTFLARIFTLGLHVNSFNLLDTREDFRLGTLKGVDWVRWAA